MELVEGASKLIKTFLKAKDDLVEPVSLADYKAMVADLFPGIDMLTPLQSDNLNQRISSEANVMAYFPPGYKCCPATIPFDNFGRALSDQQIKDGEHIHVLVINPEGETVLGFYADRSRTFDALPLELQNNAFVIPEYSIENREPLLKKFLKACNGLQAILTPPSQAS